MELLQKIKNSTLFRSAFNLMLSSGVISIFGFVFWIIIARNFTSHDVGIATTLISSALLISLLGQAGFDTTFIRFLPKARDKSAQINTGLAVSGIASAVIATVFCLASPILSHKLAFLASNLEYTAMFVGFVFFATWNTLTNAALIAYRKTFYVLIIDLLFSIVKVCLPFVITSGGPMAIFALVGIAQVVNVVLSVAVLSGKFHFKPNIQINRTVLRETKKYSLGVYIASILNLLPDSLLPIIIINRLSAPDSAYFYIAFAVANLVYTIAFAITQVMLAETANDEAHFAQHARRGMVIAMALLTPAIIAVAFAAPYLLDLFGKTYAASGLETLRIMVWSGLFVLIYSFLSFYYKHTKRLVPNIIMTAVNAISIIALSIAFTPQQGLPGIGWAWFYGTIIAVVVGIILFMFGRTRRATLPSTPKRIIISHVYSEDNKGDAALLSVLHSDIRRVYPRAKLTILTLDAVPMRHTFEGVPVKKSFMYHSLNTFKSRPMTLLYASFVMSTTILWAYVKRTFGLTLPLPKKLAEICRMYENSDLIIPVGGGYLRSQKRGIGSLLNVSQLLHPYVVAKLLGKPTILYAQSIGPFSAKLEERLVKNVLNTRVAAAIIREDVSMKLLYRIGVTIPLHRSVDSGFAFKPTQSYDLRKKIHAPRSQIVFGITARQWLSVKQQRKYETVMAKAIDYIIERHHAVVVLIPQVTATFHNDDDRIVNERILSLIKHKGGVHVIQDSLTHHEIKSCYNSLDFLVGTRFHSVIFALTSYVPAIAIEYEHKTGGIMKDLELTEWVIKMDRVNTKTLQKYIDDIVAQKNSYIAHLKQTLPKYIPKTKESTNVVVDKYDELAKNRAN